MILVRSGVSSKVSEEFYGVILVFPQGAFFNGISKLVKKVNN